MCFIWPAQCFPNSKWLPIFKSPDFQVLLKNGVGYLATPAHIPTQQQPCQMTEYVFSISLKTPHGPLCSFLFPALDLGGIRVWEQAQASNLWWPHDFLLGGSSKSSPEAFTLVHDRHILTVGPRRHMHRGPAAWESVTRLQSFVLSYRWVTEKLPAIFHFRKLNPKGLWGVAHQEDTSWSRPRISHFWARLEHPSRGRNSSLGRAEPGVGVGQEEGSFPIYGHRWPGQLCISGSFYKCLGGTTHDIVWLAPYEFVQCTICPTVHVGPGTVGGGKKQVEMVRQVQPKEISQHRFYYFLLKAAESRSGRSQDLVDQRKIRGLSGPHTAHAQMPMRW